VYWLELLRFVAQLFAHTLIEYLGLVAWGRLRSLEVIAEGDGPHLASQYFHPLRL